jgi:hypothetical protein
MLLAAPLHMAAATRLARRFRPNSLGLALEPPDRFPRQATRRLPRRVSRH